MFASSIGTTSSVGTASIYVISEALCIHVTTEYLHQQQGVPSVLCVPDGDQKFEL